MGDPRDAERVTLAGVAYAGTRGVARAEVSVDGGETWRETWRDARLSELLEGALDGDAWPTRGTPRRAATTRFARAVTEDGTVQPQTETGPFPSGASGWAETTLTV